MYLSAILDAFDKSIISFVLRHFNNNVQVFETFDSSKSNYSDVSSVFHSDRDFQYTSKRFKKKLDTTGMIQSISRVDKCINNGSMEAFWGILETKMYYLNKFNTYTVLETAVIEYINYYNNYQYQKRLNCITPTE